MPASFSLPVESSFPPSGMGDLYPWFGEMATSLRDPKTPINLSGLLTFAVSLPSRKKLSASLTLVGCIDRIVEFNAAYGGSIPVKVEFNQPISGDDFRILVLRSSLYTPNSSFSP